MDNYGTSTVSLCCSDHAGGEVADSSAHSTVQYMQEQE